MRRLGNKVAIVTGAASGIGAVAAAIFAAEGARVLIADLDIDGAESRAAAIRDTGSQASAIWLDLGDEDSIRQMIAAAVERYGGLDVLFNNAADTRLSSTVDHGVEAMDVCVWDATMHTNLRGTMLAIKHAIPVMRARGGGSIINTSSGAALRGADSPSAYGVSKAGVISLTRYVAAQHGRDGIRCNAIAPGLIVTPATVSTFAAGAIGDVLRRQHLTPRLGEPADIAWAAVWLASDESAFVTAQCICVDGGMLSHQPYLADLADLAALQS